MAARRRCIQLLGDKQAVRILFSEIAPRFADRPGGYTRIVRLSQPRLGDAGTQAILEFVGVRDRVVQRSQKPAFEDNEPVAEQEAELSAIDSRKLRLLNNMTVYSIFLEKVTAMEGSAEVSISQSRCVDCASISVAVSMILATLISSESH